MFFVINALFSVNDRKRFSEFHGCAFSKNRVGVERNEKLLKKNKYFLRLLPGVYNKMSSFD